MTSFLLGPGIFPEPEDTPYKPETRDALQVILHTMRNAPDQLVTQLCNTKSAFFVISNVFTSRKKGSPGFERRIYIEPLTVLKDRSLNSHTAIEAALVELKEPYQIWPIIPGQLSGFEVPLTR